MVSQFPVSEWVGIVLYLYSVRYPVLISILTGKRGIKVGFLQIEILSNVVGEPALRGVMMSDPFDRQVAPSSEYCKELIQFATTRQRHWHADAFSVL